MESQLPFPAATNAPAGELAIGRPIFVGADGGGRKRVRACTEAERDWEIVFSDLLPKVADLVLLSDVKDYMALRGVCKPWRAATTDPKLMGMDPRFFPRHWEMAKEDACIGEKARFRNHLTGASIELNIPHEYGDVVASAEGLLVLLASGWKMRLFNPVTGAVADLPNVFLENPPWPIEWNAAGLVYDNGEADPTVVLYVTVGKPREVIMHAKPGEAIWQIGDLWPALSESGLSVRGQFYLPTLEGDVLRYALRPQPHFVSVARQHPRQKRSSSLVMRSFLQLARHRDGMMRMQLQRNIDTDVEVFWVDVAEAEGSLTLVQQHDLADADERPIHVGA